MANEKGKRIEYFDIMRFLMCLGVCWSHSVGSYIVGATHAVPYLPWAFGAFGQTFVRICVSVFFMISGALLLGSEKNLSIKYVYKKRVLKWVLMLIIWSSLYYVLMICIGEVEPSFQDFRDRLLTRGFASGYWYLYALIMLQALLPALAVLTQKAGKQYLWLLVGIGGVVVYLPGFVYDTTEVEITVFYAMMMGTPAIMAFILGYLFTTTEIPKKTRIAIYLFGLFSFGITYYNALKMYPAGYDGTWFRESSIFVLGMTVAFFVFCRYAKVMTKMSRLRIVKLGAAVSLGVYLVHQFVIKLYLYFKPINLPAVSVLFIGKYFVVITLISFVIAYILYRIPGVKKLVT